MYGCLVSILLGFSCLNDLLILCNVMPVQNGQHDTASYLVARVSKFILNRSLLFLANFFLVLISNGGVNVPV